MNRAVYYIGKFSKWFRWQYWRKKNIWYWGHRKFMLDLAGSPENVRKVREDMIKYFKEALKDEQ